MSGNMFGIRDPLTNHITNASPRIRHFIHHKEICSVYINTHKLAVAIATTAIQVLSVGCGQWEVPCLVFYCINIIYQFDLINPPMALRKGEGLSMLPV